MFDTHVNLHGEAFSEDLEDVLNRGRQVRISRFLAICDRIDNFPAVLAIAQKHADIWCTVGVHPHHAKDFPDLTPEDLTAHTSIPEVVAIGETGLDFHYNYSDQASQVTNLKRHIVAARQTGLPIILHCRDADELMGDILESEMQAGAFKMLLHCYTGGLGLARKATELGAYFSVSGILSFKSAANVREVIAQLPTDRIILETDCPFLAPVPYRGRRNEPAYLPEVAAAYAKLMELHITEVAELTEQNSLKLFQKVS